MSDGEQALRALAAKLEGWWLDSAQTEERKLIIKALGLAADMEKLLPYDPELRYSSRNGIRDVVLVLWVKEQSVGFRGRDIYAVVREAVAALEEKR